MLAFEEATDLLRRPAFAQQLQNVFTQGGVAIQFGAFPAPCLGPLLGMGRTITHLQASIAP
jgi:hypothetical protein